MSRLYNIAAALLIFTSSAAAHELTPTYPVFKPSYIDDVVTTKMNLWNRRQDVSYYEISVFDKDWSPILFASPDKIIKTRYLEHKSFDIYIREIDIKKAVYVCTVSKTLKKDADNSVVTSKICSRIKRDEP